MLGHATLAVAITWCRNTAGQLTVVTVITAARAPTMAITFITVPRAIMAVDRVTRTTVPTRTARRTTATDPGGMGLRGGSARASSSSCARPERSWPSRTEACRAEGRTRPSGASPSSLRRRFSTVSQRFRLPCRTSPRRASSRRNSVTRKKWKRWGSSRLVSRTKSRHCSARTREPAHGRSDGGTSLGADWHAGRYLLLHTSAARETRSNDAWITSDFSNSLNA